MHHRTVEITKHLIDHTGAPLIRKSRYVVLRDGMHYQDERTGEWLESRDLIEPHPLGAAAQYAAHKVIFSRNINTEGAIDYLSAGGTRLRSHVLGLYYTNADTGESVLIANIRDSAGKILPPNQIVYLDCFDGLGVSGDLRYTFSGGRFEQDAILNEIPSPQVFGLDPSLTRLEVVTEFIDPAQPVKTRHAIRTKNSPVPRGLTLPDLIDETLDFGGGARMIPGKAFAFPDDEQIAPSHQDVHSAVPVAKTWTRVNGRDLLIEAVEFPALKPLGVKISHPKMSKTDISPLRALPERRMASTAERETVQVAALPYRSEGVVIDYVIVNSQSSFTFQMGTTYLIEGTVTIHSYAMIYGGAIIKYAKGAVLKFLGSSSVSSWGGRAILTARDDDTVGEVISTEALTGTYASVAIAIYDSGGGSTTTMRNLQIRHAAKGIDYYPNYPTHYVQDSEFIACNMGVSAFGSNIHLSNLTFCDVGTPYKDTGYTTFYTSNLIYLNGTDDSDADGLSDYIEMTKFLSNPLDGYSQGSSNEDGVYFTTAGFGTDTEATLTDIDVNGSTVTLTLSNASENDFYDIFFAEYVTGPWQLRHSGPATAGEGTTTKNYTFEETTGTGFYQAWLHTDTDFDGLPDGYEIVVTRGVPGMGDNVAGNPDSDGDGTYDSDEDMDGDGLPELAELRLLTDPHTPDNPLHLQHTALHVSTVSGIVAIPLQFGAEFREQSYLSISLFVDGVQSGDIEFWEDPLGERYLLWETRHDGNGIRQVQLAYQYRSRVPAAGLGFHAFGSAATVTTDNILQFNRLTSYRGGRLFVDAMAVIAPADYEVRVFDESLTLRGIVEGTSNDGRIAVVFDDGNGGPLPTTEDFYVEVYVAGGGASIASVAPEAKWIPYDAGTTSSGKFTVAWGWHEGTQRFKDHREELMLEGVINIIANPALDNEYALLPIQNTFTASAFEFKAIQQGRQQMLDALLDPASTHFFWFGHGEESNFGPLTGDNPINILNEDVRQGLENWGGSHGYNHPYKLTILNGCSMHGIGWVRAFGVDYSRTQADSHTVQEYLAIDRDPRALVAWTADLSVPGYRRLQFSNVDRGKQLEYAEGLAGLFANWMGEARLDNCMDAYVSKIVDEHEFGEEHREYVISGCVDLTRED